MDFYCKQRIKILQQIPLPDICKAPEIPDPCSSSRLAVGAALMHLSSEFGSTSGEIQAWIQTNCPEMSVTDIEKGLKSTLSTGAVARVPACTILNYCEPTPPQRFILSPLMNANRCNDDVFNFVFLSVGGECGKRFWLWFEGGLCRNPTTYPGDNCIDCFGDVSSTCGEDCTPSQ